MGQDLYSQALGQFTPQAQAFGMIPNTYANPGQQMADAQRFMAMSKAMMDTINRSYQRWGGAGAGGPNNFTSAMSLPMLNMYSQYGSLANSLAGQMLSPGGAQGMLGQGGYQFGGMGNNMSPLLQMYLGQMQNLSNPQKFSGSDFSNAANAGGGNGPLQVNSGGGQSALPAGGQSSASANGGGGGGVPVLSGVNNAARGIIPGLGGAEDILGGLMGRGGSNNPNQQGDQMTVNTQGPMARTRALVMQKLGGINAIPPGVNADDYIDNIVYNALNSMTGGGQQ